MVAPKVREARIPHGLPHTDCVRGFPRQERGKKREERAENGEQTEEQTTLPALFSALAV
jgi:hypothetical protein